MASATPQSTPRTVEEYRALARLERRRDLCNLALECYHKPEDAAEAREREWRRDRLLALIALTLLELDEPRGA